MVLTLRQRQKRQASRPAIKLIKWALLLSVVLHAIVLTLWLNEDAFLKKQTPDAPQVQVLYLEAVAPAPHPPSQPERLAQPRNSEPLSQAAIAPESNQLLSATQPVDRTPGRMEAPPPPSAEEWALAGQYTLKNSKRYRYNWGQQVRSMMGTAIEGPDQGVVRFRIEIAPDGHIVSVQTLWTTSDMAEKLARDAISKMPSLPPTPNGKPLIFEQTISFQPFATGGPPTYQDDCLPDPPVYRNRFAWDGRSLKTQADPPVAEKPDPQALAECLKQLPPDTVESVSAHNQRQFDQWRSKHLD